MWHRKMKRSIVLVTSIVLLLNCTSRKENNYLSPSVQKAIEDPDYGRKSKDLTIQKEEAELIKENPVEKKIFGQKD